MYAFETVTIVVTAGAGAAGLWEFMRGGGPLAQLGRQGTLWFEHVTDRPLADAPSEDQVDMPIPRRSLCGLADWITRIAPQIPRGRGFQSPPR